ncbi:MAG: bifunctional (p)ppGpp synthetase/guanosine-3',5'-bis(diphosphate) 3'-pyrophosphohydrolase [Myxococcales bacterium]|nr:bifunctional (p)ppGpp synthetase/guanosine-3',5'-bis(diphosphate) 3'-pyrophosphohydrolase [Myxococcales bacterium]
MASYSPLIDRALVVSATAHRNQARKGSQVPYIIHPVHVALLLLRHHFPDEVIIAALLHDVVEDTSTSLSELRAEFGEEVARLVAAVSEQKTEGTEPLPWKVRKEAQLRKLQHADRHIAAIKTADALHNLQATLSDLRQRGPEVWSRFRSSQSDQLWYYRSLHEVLSQRLGDHPLLAELGDALSALQHSLPAS